MALASSPIHALLPTRSQMALMSLLFLLPLTDGVTSLSIDGVAVPPLPSLDRGGGGESHHGTPPLWAHVPAPYPRTLPLLFSLYQSIRRHLSSTNPYGVTLYQTIRRHCPPHPTNPYGLTLLSLIPILTASPFYQSPRRHSRLRTILLIK
jgi:hypothetical protein